MATLAPHVSDVLIVDDHPTICAGVSALIRKLGFVKVCGEANSAASALELFRELEPHIVIMDIGLPDGDGIDIAHIMCTEKPDTVILMLSMHEDALYAVRALRAGAAGYLRKDDGLVELATALQKIAGGQSHVSPSFQNHAILNALKKPDHSEDSFLDVLSDRQKDVFYCLGKGMARSEIAAELGLSIKTVETHRTHIKKKLGLSSSEETLQLAKDWQDLETNSSPNKINT